ncbi:hypothetical protein QYE76_058394 [Lolium multiflorum]|uniref:F-box domain-containing protein n=1 Tax=Lolium multiflorum TaxID=4521 RepID=A0AAD8T6E3_LOLMU|nr:hypothetical protein QYE76_058394 [Lolium multiflorum]
MVARGVDRLSELPDDLLRRVLHFAPLREAASTTALSRRWRAPLWRSSGALNLETGKLRTCYDNPRFFTQRDCFVAAAEAALDATDVPVRRLTLRLDSDLHQRMGDIDTWYRDRAHDKVVSRYTGLVDVALSHGAARRGVEELRIVANPKSDYLYTRDHTGLFTVTLHSLQLETIRVLDLTHCKGLLGTHLALPRLSSLRLSHCSQHLRSLQQAIDAAPALAAIRLETVLIDATDKETKHGTTRHLRCPAATVLVLDSCKWEEESQSYNYETTVPVQAVEIHAPRLRRFRYKGQLRSFSFSAQPPELEQVDLDFSGRGNNGNSKDPERDLATFWRFGRSFTSTRELRLRVNHLEDIAILSEARRAELLPAFRCLERLEVQGVDSTKGKAAAMAILNMLRCCPMLAALRINLTAEKKADSSNKKGAPDTRPPQKEIQIASLAQCHLFQCLQSSLVRVALQFQLEKSNCLGVKLIKFFAENAIVLEEMYIDGGDENLCKHMNPKTEKWNSKRRKSGATSFVVLPLER